MDYFEWSVSFESGYGQNISDWLITSADNMESAAYAEDGGHNGMRQLSHWSGSSKYQVDTYQNIETLPTGIYTLSAWVKSCGTQKECCLRCGKFTAMVFGRVHLYRGNRKVSLHRTGTEAISYRAAHQDQTGPRRAGYWIFCMGTVLD